MANEVQPIIVIKKVKGHGGGHHGGAWKVAYADFVTAMMAFFLLLWLLNATTDQQKLGIADYFAPSPMSGGKSGSGGLFGGQSLSADGAMRAQGGISVAMPMAPDTAAETEEIDEEELAELIEKRERESFDEAANQLRSAIDSVPELAQLKDSLVIDQTPEGLRIQLVDQERIAMFARGGADPLDHTKRLLALVTEVVGKLPNQISISGHTDATPYRGAGDYSNWELSADRANAARRELLANSLDAARIAQVQGKAQTDPLDIDEPTSPRNRRISIVLLREAGVNKSGASSGPLTPPEKVAPRGALRPPTTLVEPPEFIGPPALLESPLR